MSAPVLTADIMMIGALMWATPGADVDAVLSLVFDDDVESNAGAEVLAAVRRLINSGRPAHPPLVLDELQRAGVVREHNGVANYLNVAATSGGEPMTVRSYAAAVVGQSLRRRIATYGRVLTTAALEAAEVELGSHVEQAARVIGDCAERLERLRGDAE